MNIHVCAIWIYIVHTAAMNFLRNATFFAVSQCRDFSLQYHSAEDEKMPMMCYHLRSCVPKLVKRFFFTQLISSTLITPPWLFSQISFPGLSAHWRRTTILTTGGFLIAVTWKWKLKSKWVGKTDQATACSFWPWKCLPDISFLAGSLRISYKGKLFHWFHTWKEKNFSESAHCYRRYHLYHCQDNHTVRQS